MSFEIHGTRQIGAGADPVSGGFTVPASAGEARLAPQGKPLAARARHRRGVNLRAGNRSAIER